jgi:hypothetical protein
MAYNVHDFIDTACEDGPAIAAVGIIMYIGYRVLVDSGRMKPWTLKQ